MAIRDPDIKLLWGRSGNRCAMCRIELSFDAQGTSAAFPLGEQAHIVAREPGGPRGQSPLTLAERDLYSNLILLCPTDHSRIDKAPEDHPVEELLRIKAEHEEWVRESLSEEKPRTACTLAATQGALEAQDYARSLSLLRVVVEPDRETPVYHYLCALTLLAGRSVNGIGTAERHRVVRHLRSARSLDRSWRPALLLMLVMDLDYFEVHGLANDFDLSATELAEGIRSADPAPALEELLLKLPMNARTRRAICLSMEGFHGAHND
ncbi:MAG TPA: hypothetical protein DD490_24785 [Acidobacteria bacterium]|nr:hypothetical protein [Acidobacteriota bacterium]